MNDGLTEMVIDLTRRKVSSEDEVLHPSVDGDLRQA
jgi:hypothetical protein